MYFVLYKYQTNSVTRSEQFENIFDARRFENLVKSRHGTAKIQNEEPIISVECEIPDFSDLDTYSQKDIVCGNYFYETQLNKNSH